jgi:hypothetical protein
MTERETRILDYEDESVFALAEWLVDTEDELEMWKARALQSEAQYKGEDK